jgi:hypothetical protein
MAAYRLPETVMHIDPSWHVSFKIALHLFFLCVGVALACSELAELLR